MGKTVYIFSSGDLKRKGDTIVLETEEGRKHFPVETTDELLIFGEVNVNKRFLEFCTEKQMGLHFFNHHGYYQGSYYPREYLNAGAVILAQAKHCVDNHKRMDIARRFVEGSMDNMRVVLHYYRRRGVDRVIPALSRIEEYRNVMVGAVNVSELMGLEGNGREAYYSAFDHITGGGPFAFDVRSRRPPQNRMNALISFLNSMCYVTALSQIYRTHLDPRIGFLHETNFRRFSLNLDVAEIFKPILVDRIIFSLINKKVIQAKHFDDGPSGGIYLQESGRKIVVSAWEERLQQTIDHPRLKRKVSYRGLMRMEVHKLEKHILGDQTYEPHVSGW
ncbi:MAG: type I-B CRISPR-associated endonuclease Cas1 [Synergistales bacterium]|nr:type I-B CRISPR-associated endonuclease Cas1 [Synergistales bacterium]